MEGEDLDNLIADSIGGVQSALEGERKAATSSGAAAGPAAGGAQQDWAKEAVKELQQGPGRSDGQAGGAPGEEFFSELIKKFQDDNFQKAMADALQGPEGDKSATPAVSDKPASATAEAPPAAASGGSSSSAAAGSGGGGDTGAEDFLQNFMKSFDSAMANNGGMEKSLSSLMTSMLSNDLICEPLEQIAEKLEPWLKSQKGLAQSERGRYEAQLKMYKQILHVYRTCGDPLPDNAREEVQRLLTELHALGQPPDEVMRQIAPKEAENGGESFEDFMKSMGLDNNLGGAEQDLLKKLSEDPEELTKVMSEMAEGLPEEACKQQ